METPQPVDSSVSAASLIKPCLEKIKQNTTGRKHAKLQSDLEGLLEKLDVLLAGTTPPIPTTIQPQSPSPLQQPPQPISDSLSVDLQASTDNDRITLTLSPSKELNAQSTQQQDIGHMPSSPTQRQTGPGARRPGALADGAAREMMLVLRDAIETRKPIVMDVSLDCLQKLIAFKLIQGPVHSINHKREAYSKTTEGIDDVATPLQFAAQPPQAQAVELICSCDDTGDEAVELRLLKALLTAATSPTLPLHGQALLLAVRAAYNVFLTSRSQVTQATAKATLTQVLTVVFQRLEAKTLSIVVPPITVTDLLGLPPADSSSMSAFVQQFLADVAVAVDPFGVVAEGVQASLDDAFAAIALDGQDGSVSASSSANDLLDPSDPTDRQRISWRTTDEQIHDGGNDGNDGDTTTNNTNGGDPYRMTTVIDDGTEHNNHGNNNNNNNSIINDGDSETSGTTMGITTMTSSPSRMHTSGGLQATLEKDAFLVFRALCKLSIRSADPSTAAEITTLRGKILALELLKILLENSGPAFRSGQRFVNAIKQYLCLSLLKNCSSSTPTVQHLCSSIFLTLYCHFRKNLKAEIGVFYPMILLRPIEPAAGSGAGGSQSGAASSTSSSSSSGGSDIAQKAVALRCLQGLCTDGQMLVDLFVNYDCDLGGANLFERTITAAVRLAQGGGHSPSHSIDSPEVQAIRYESLRFLVSALTTLRVWYDAATQAIDAAVVIGDDSAPRKSSTTTTTTTSDDKDRDTTTATEDGSGGNGHTSNGLQEDQVKSAAGGTELGDVADGLRSTWMERLASGQAAPAPIPGKNQAELLQSWKAFKRIFEESVAAFNKKPKKGISLMQSQKLIGENPEDVAQFLATTRGLNKTAIGDYLGERDDFNLKVMHSYVDALDFTDLEFDSAIRKFLAGFRLPGEAQKIDRLMEKFAERFVRCNPDAFKSADVAYVLAYSVIMLNTDAHNPMVKNKMTKADFLRNNRGINDGGDLPVEFMESLYDRILSNEIKMKDEPMGVDGSSGTGASSGAATATTAASTGWLDTFMSLLPGRQRATNTEPTEEVISRTAEYLREQAKGATFYATQDGAAVQPMIDVSWAPLLGAFSVLFEEQDDGHFIAQCLEGFVEMIALTSRLSMGMLRSTFVSSLAGFTMLHAPPRMRIKHAQAFRALLRVADGNGNALADDWLIILRCFSRFELLLSLSAGTPSDASLFSHSSTTTAKKGTSNHTSSHEGIVESYSSIVDMSLQASAHHSPTSSSHSSSFDSSLPSETVLLAVDSQELNRIFVDSIRLDGDAIVGFVRSLCSVAQEELRPDNPPRVYSLTKIVETAHFNMQRIRLVWGRIWAVLSDFFVAVGCHENLGVSMYAVDSLRQLSMKFLERDEMANYNFQNDFLRPFVVLVRRSKSAEIRELVIRCVSQMVLARATNIKSGWKSVFMVFTTAASDESAHVVRLAFDTVEKIVREHFSLITEVETTTFTDCVNCLVAFTNNPHSLDVSLNAIAFLRFCAGELAEGDIDVGKEGLPEGTAAFDINAHRIRPAAHNDSDDHTSISSPSQHMSSSHSPSPSPSPSPSTSSRALGIDIPSRRPGGGIRFTDKDEHMYFWFPLLAGLSELTFDPRQEIRYGALGVLFDILKFHGASFTPRFWIRVYDSVILPMFDHVRAEVTDTTTFTDEARRAEVDAWLYDTCTATLQHLVDVVAKYYVTVPALLDKTLDLLGGFVRRSHRSLAGVGAAALARLAIAVGETADEATWLTLARSFRSAVDDTMPHAADLIRQRMEHRGNGTVISDGENTANNAAAGWSLGHGAGARRLSELKCRASVQLLLAQALGEVYAAHSRTIPTSSAIECLDALQKISEHAIAVDADTGLRHSLTLAQAADAVPPESSLKDPPFIKLEVDSSQAYLSVLMTIMACGPDSIRRDGDVEGRLVSMCIKSLERFEQQSQSVAAAMAEVAEGGRAFDPRHRDACETASALSKENEMLAPVAVATLKAMLSFSQETFQTRVKDIFPLLSDLISCDVAPEVQRCLSEIFSKRIASLVL